MIAKFFARRLVAALLLGLLALAPATATVNSTASKTIALGNGVTTTFNFSFVGVAAAYISVILTDASGNETVLTQGSGTTQYQITLNAPVTGAIWGLGGSVTYNPSGTPIPAGSTLTIFRTLPLTQAISLQNQNSLARLGNGAETGLDLGVMQVQQNAETLARAIKVPIVDATPPADLPPIAQRANKGAVFDSLGNLVAGQTPSGGVISSAMQPVVNAATLALGRTAFGLGGLSTEGFGSGLQDDGAGSARVNTAVSQVASNQAIHKADHLKVYAASGALTFTLDRANTLFSGFTITIYALTSSVVVTPNGNDNFFGMASGASQTIPVGGVMRISTDAGTSGLWLAEPTGASDSTVKAWASFGSTGTILASYNVQTVTHPATGLYAVIFNRSFASTAYQCNVTTEGSSAAGIIGTIASGGRAADRVSLSILNSSFTSADPAVAHVACHGRQ